MGLRGMGDGTRRDGGWDSPGWWMGLPGMGDGTPRDGGCDSPGWGMGLPRMGDGTPQDGATMRASALVSGMCTLRRSSWLSVEGVRVRGRVSVRV